MELNKLLKGVSYSVLQGNANIEVKKIEYDSRKVTAGDVFVCITGFQRDGHTFAAKAVKSGAVALICEYVPEGIDKEVTIFQVENSREALAFMAVQYFNQPSPKMHVIGVTGTNGKTTTTYLMKSILDHMEKKVGVVGTIENRIGDRVLHTERTTPESKELQELLDTMVKEDVSHVVMEVSSHSLDLHRVDGIEYEIGIFTNLTQDHLDYHKTMENYKEAKSKLFERAQKSVINLDDAAGSFMRERAKGQVLTFAVENDADLRARNIEISAEGTEFSLTWEEKEYHVHLSTPGRFSVYNALGAIGACLLLGISMTDILVGLKENQGVAGRFQAVRSKKGYQGVVDYAHTPDGLDNILKTAREFAKGRIITIFGCGGDRDKTKRPIMGEIAGNGSDYCIITSDNPRTEDPLTILNEVEAGMKKTQCPYEKIADRRAAILQGTKMAKTGDVIIIAGKGHENYQIFKDCTIHFDDMEEIRKAFGEDCI
ncbi:UDP-N-acetylmuramoyl-L-alanyl-D-glutamate--2,6-diaminopimelate ligase [Anaerotignum neopropionicum]|uniref:UDP-N-acetylmuramoyl-L-alanyl-D-glutamate--2,6-diaminopimelate ligase n=1 Tax=Anaerotignum neopropionicum TaxID=36847 RepID=A0A136WFR5_9FIRM|nr:UDP-N-acetylmuramoyl-L-alanyl-D-glutamate--2,6-diaminopimelate ligase [Anaerotignum neopropionicum]KXL53344.1 UDP-N-acetylmuramoyl-L-alanyl-D-glutamate--2,6-diaminopimelate ligase [Anaerotignum neopropionicum]